MPPIERRDRRQPTLQLAGLVQLPRPARVAQADQIGREERRQGEHAPVAPSAQGMEEGGGRPGQHREVVGSAGDVIGDIADVAARFLHPDDVGVFGQPCHAVHGQVTPVNMVTL